MLGSPLILETSYGDITIRHFQGSGQKECLVLANEFDGAIPNVRIHSSCVFSESFHAVDCDCGRQLDAFLKLMCNEGGFLFYNFEEGRGAGIRSKIEAIVLEKTNGVSTADAFKSLGLAPDLRDYSVSVAAMKAVGVPSNIVLASNNPAKESALKEAGFIITERHKLEFETNNKIDAYIRGKTDSLGHHARD